jgi:NADH dehydrogenase
MLLLTGATGQVGTALLRRLTADGRPVRALVRDPRRLGPERVRVQIALGDLTDPPSFRNALRGVKTVVHLAASARDQPRGSIEELNGIATWRLVQAAERAGVQHFVYFSALSASVHDRTRFLRAKALAEEAVRESGLQHTIFAPSLVYSPGDRHLSLLEWLSWLPAVPVPGRAKAQFQPIWAEDVADCVMAVLGNGGSHTMRRHELAGPDTLDHMAVAELVLRAAGREKPLLGVPERLTRASLKTLEALMKSKAPATWDEAELLQVSMTSVHGTADAEALGVHPRPMAAVLGAAV